MRHSNLKQFGVLAKYVMFINFHGFGKGLRKENHQEPDYQSGNQSYQYLSDHRHYEASAEVGLAVQH